VSRANDAASVPGVGAGALMSGGPRIERIGQIAIPVADLERGVAFYSDVLGLRLLFRAP
jgi:catechol-2,3-dioxygenase